jgi:hypothetical protein
MSDDPSKRGTPDRDTISLAEAHEVHYWCQKFNCTESELRAAVAAVGKSAKAVEAYFKRKRG